jgi:retinol dehydrogenase-12
MNILNHLVPPPPIFTENQILDLSSKVPSLRFLPQNNVHATHTHKVYIITSATMGTGLSLAKILYSLHSTIYIGSPCLSSYTTAVATITSQHPTSKGVLHPFIADFSSPSTIAPATASFLAAEYRLDVLFLDYFSTSSPAGNKSANGGDTEMNVYYLSSFLLFKLLSPLMSNIAGHFCHANSSIRVVWASNLLASTPGNVIQFDNTGVPLSGDNRVGMYLLAYEFSRRQKQAKANDHGLPIRNPHGVLHISVNSETEIMRYMPATVRVVMDALSRGPKYGAYTELYAGLAPVVEDGDFVVPWGRKGTVPAHVVESTMAKDGTTSVSARLYGWCEEQVTSFVDTMNR